MLSEMIITAIPECLMLQINTDGLTVKIPKDKQNKYYEVCKKWEEVTKLELEYVDYSKMVIRDVNSYLSVSTNGKIKRKGAFKLHSEMIADGEYHKAFNQGIVPIALSEYYINGTSPEETIRNHKNLFDFGKSFNATHGWKAESLIIDEEGNEHDLREEQKSNRFYVSKSGRKFRKRGEPLKYKHNTYINYNDPDHEQELKSIKAEIDALIPPGVNRLEQKVMIECSAEIYSLLSKYIKNLNYIFNVHTVEFTKSQEHSLFITVEKAWRLIDIEADGLVIIFNEYEEKENFEDYKVDYDYYIEECYKIMDTISGEKERLIVAKKEEARLAKIERETKNYLDFCINKNPTQRQYDLYKRDYLIEKYGEPKEIKTSRTIKKDKNKDQLSLFDIVEGAKENAEKEVQKSV